MEAEVSVFILMKKLPLMFPTIGDSSFGEHIKNNLQSLNQLLRYAEDSEVSCVGGGGGDSMDDDDDQKTAVKNEAVWETNTYSALHLGRLNEEESWRLFSNKVQITEDELNNSELITFKDQILNICGGLPSTIALLGDLPSLVKPCFNYMGLFPRGFEVPVMKLFLLWCAEGFMTPSITEKLDREDLEEICLEELATRNMVEVRWRRDGTPKICCQRNFIRKWVQSFTRLRKLKLIGWPTLASEEIAEWISKLTSPETLKLVSISDDSKLASSITLCTTLKQTNFVSVTTMLRSDAAPVGSSVAAPEDPYAFWLHRQTTRAMPCLRELEIRSCQHLGDVTGLQNVTTLKELVLTNIPNDFGAKVGKFLEDGDAYIRYNTWSSSPPFMSRRVALELIPPGVRKLWKDWDLRLTILLSLIIQILFGNRRKNNQKPWIRGLGSEAWFGLPTQLLIP
ncbi:hypothetical protein Q3G72_022398 [Acer saccharum]|nr:hypothetical protein Q3G72_022398 [Acer saccharum]